MYETLTGMRTKVASIILAAITISLPPHSIHAQAPSTLFDRLHRAAQDNTLDSAGTQPFHLQLTIDIIPQVGRPAQHGTLEMWWSSPDEQRIDYDLPPYRATVVHNAKGEFRTEHTANPPYIVSHLLNEILHPLPLELVPATSVLESSKLPVGGITFDCMTLTRSAAKTNEAVPTTYCFDDQARFRIKVASTDQYNIRQKLGAFRGRYIPLDLRYTFLNKPVATAHLEFLKGQQPAYPQASDTTGLVFIPAPPAKIPGSQVAGRLLRHPDPVYPLAAKVSHVSGTVLLHGIIGVSGSVEKLELIGSPDDSLTTSAIDAVRKWIYTPYLVSGVATEVDTTITVNFIFSSR